MALGDLIIKTREEAASAEPLDLLTAAARQQEALSDIGDALSGVAGGMFTASPALPGRS